MAKVLKISVLAAVALMLLVPVAIIASVPIRDHFIQASYDRIALGDTRSIVEQKMGSRFTVAEGSAKYLAAPVEHQYHFWPIPTIWVIGIKDDVVVEKEVLVSP